MQHCGALSEHCRAMCLEVDKCLLKFVRLLHI
jgi:hypothetical protein